MDGMTDELAVSRGSLARDIVGEIVMSESPERVIKKWREIFKVSQKSLAQKLGITSSVISDYESGRRRSPGIKVINKYISTLLDIDSERGGGVIKSFSRGGRGADMSDAVLDMKELEAGVSSRRFCKSINAELVVDAPLKSLYGYTIIDSFKAITEFSFKELVRLYGATTQRALVFTKVETGRTPMVAIKLTGLQPALVVLHGLDTVDEVAKRIAEVEGIPLAICRLENADMIAGGLKGMG